MSRKSESASHASRSWEASMPTCPQQPKDNKQWKPVVTSRDHSRDFKRVATKQFSFDQRGVLSRAVSEDVARHFLSGFEWKSGKPDCLQVDICLAASINLLLYLYYVPILSLLPKPDHPPAEGRRWTIDELQKRSGSNWRLGTSWSFCLWDSRTDEAACISDISVHHHLPYATQDSSQVFSLFRIFACQPESNCIIHYNPNIIPQLFH